MDVKKIIVLCVVVIFISLVIFGLIGRIIDNGAESENNNIIFKRKAENSTKQNNQSVNSSGDNSAGKKQGQPEKDGASSGGGTTGGSADQNTVREYTSEVCGSYYRESGICGGICIKGECVNEGESCYCKILN